MFEDFNNPAIKTRLTKKTCLCFFESDVAHCTHNV